MEKIGIWRKNWVVTLMLNEGKILKFWEKMIGGSKQIAWKTILAYVQQIFPDSTPFNIMSLVKRLHSYASNENADISKPISSFQQHYKNLLTYFSKSFVLVSFLQ